MFINRARVSPTVEKVSSFWPISKIVGLVSAHLAYPLAEKIEKREIRSKIFELRAFYQLPLTERRKISAKRLQTMVEFAANRVPYYRDLFQKYQLDPKKIALDTRYLSDIPFLTKDIIREQGLRMLSCPLNDVRHHICKTGGSTGLSCHIYYDQIAADYSAATTLYARERVGKSKSKSELHFACRFPDTPTITDWFTREDFKCFAMNRTNIFFDRIDDVGLEEIWGTLKRRKPYLVHAHPSTIYALACYVEKKYGPSMLFSIFESSGELLENYQRQLISNVFKCDVIDRYGLAEMGVMAYQLVGSDSPMQVLDSEGWAESINFGDSEDGCEELVLTGFRNYLMPLIRYRTGDLGHILMSNNGSYLSNVVGRIHDQVPINGIKHATHHIQDMLDHRIGGIQEFQIDLRCNPPKLRIVPEGQESILNITNMVKQFWGDGFTLEFIGHDELVRIGRHAKFRHVVHP